MLCADPTSPRAAPYLRPSSADQLTSRQKRRSDARLSCFHFGFQSSVTQLPSVIYQHLPAAPNRVSACIGCSWVTLDAEFGGLKIRVSVVRFRPWPPSDQKLRPAVPTSAVKHPVLLG